MQVFLVFNILPILYQISFISVIALVIGSFISLVSHRIISKEPMVMARSKCVSCNNPLKAHNLIPILSWVFQRGKCGKCHAKISSRYPLIELATLLSFLLVFYANNFELNWLVILEFAIAGTLILMTVVDIEHYFIPDVSQFFLAILALLTIFLQPNFDKSLLFFHLKSAIVFLAFIVALMAFFYVFSKEQGIGVDDLKFFCVAGLLLGLNHFLLFLMMSGFFGIIFGLIWRKLKKDDTFPFAPSLCLAMLITMLFGNKIDVVDVFGRILL